MIPKVIHYCWFGKNPLPDSAKQCIASWKKYFPDYEIKEWNESNFDIEMTAYTKEAYIAKKYAFVSDYARFWILYNYGGVYFDTDVEVVKDFTPILEKGAFLGWEKGVYLTGVNPGLGMACDSGNTVLLELLTLYNNMSFNAEYAKKDRKTITEYTFDVLTRFGLKKQNREQLIQGIYVYPSDYFCPVDVVTKRLHITDNTYSIHNYTASWNERTNKGLKKRLREVMPEWLLILLYKIKH